MAAKRDGMNGDTFSREFRVARNKLLHGALIAGLLAVLGLWFLFFAGASVPEAELAGLLNLMLAAAILFFALRRARDPRPQMVLDREGVWYRDWGLDKVPWNAIAAVGTGGSRLQPFAALELRDPESYLAGLSQTERRRIGNSRLYRVPRLLVPNGALDAPLDEVLAALRAGLEQNSEDRSR
jgi:hypothetical protein